MESGNGKMDDPTRLPPVRQHKHQTVLLKTVCLVYT